MRNGNGNSKRSRFCVHLCSALRRHASAAEVGFPPVLLCAFLMKTLALAELVPIQLTRRICLACRLKQLVVLTTNFALF